MKFPITERFSEKILNQCRGGYLETNWGLFDLEGNSLGKEAKLQPNMYIATENGMSYIILFVNSSMEVKECEVIYGRTPQEITGLPGEEAIRALHEAGHRIYGNKPRDPDTFKLCGEIAQDVFLNEELNENRQS